MGHIGVPWFIGGAADHSAEVARLLAYNATGGREGIIGQSDCRVLALPTPGPGIRAMPGAYNIRMQSHRYGMYLGMITSEDVVGTTPTSSSGARSDLVCFRVENPNVAGEPWDMPSDPVAGPYVRTVIIEGVPPGTTKFSQLGLLDSALTVARIDFPPSTATVTQSMIKDLRAGAVDAEPGDDPPSTPPAAASQTYTRFLQGVAAADTLLYTHNTHRNWPLATNLVVPVPSYATTVDYEVMVVNVRQRKSSANAAGDVFGETRINLGGAISAPTIYNANYEGNDPNNYNRITIPAGGTMAVPSALRGRNVNFQLQARSYWPNPSFETGNLQFTTGSYAKVWLHFKSSPTLFIS